MCSSCGCKSAETGKKNCGCGQDPCKTYGAENEGDWEVVFYAPNEKEAIDARNSFVKGKVSRGMIRFDYKIEKAPDREGWNILARPHIKQAETFSKDKVVCIKCGIPSGFPHPLNELPSQVAGKHKYACRNCYNEIAGTWNAETFEAPYAGVGSLFGIGQNTGLEGFTTSELTTSSAIHGDFDEASLNYSGHQNFEVRAENLSREGTFNIDIESYIDNEDELEERGFSERDIEAMRQQVEEKYNDGDEVFEDLKTNELDIYINGRLENDDDEVYLKYGDKMVGGVESGIDYSGDFGGFHAETFEMQPMDEDAKEWFRLRLKRMREMPQEEKDRRRKLAMKERDASRRKGAETFEARTTRKGGRFNPNKNVRDGAYIYTHKKDGIPMNHDNQKVRKLNKALRQQGVPLKTKTKKMNAETFDAEMTNVKITAKDGKETIVKIPVQIPHPFDNAKINTKNVSENAQLESHVGDWIRDNHGDFYDFKIMGAETFEAEDGDDCPSCANACKHDDSNKIKVESIYDYEVQSPSNMVIQVTCLDCGESGTFYADDVDWHGEKAKLRYSPQIAVNMMNPTYGDLKCSRCHERFQMAAEIYMAETEKPFWEKIEMFSKKKKESSPLVHGLIAGCLGVVALKIMDRVKK